jgi:glutamate dehydrogenase (NADP+)
MNSAIGPHKGGLRFHPSVTPSIFKFLAFVKDLKFQQLGRIKTYAEKYPSAEYIEADASDSSNPLWNHWADCVFPAATENEIQQRDAYNLINHRIKVVCEGANMPCTARAINVLQSCKDILYAPAKASNAGGAAAAGLEMAQNSMRLSWTQKEVDQRLKLIMNDIHRSCLAAAEQYGKPGNYIAGANIAGFIRVADAMIDQGIV